VGSGRGQVGQNEEFEEKTKKTKDERRKTIDEVASVPKVVKEHDSH